MANIGEIIAQARTQKKLTQQQVADHFGIARVSVTNWESGKTKPDQDKLTGLAQLLDLAIDDLLPEGAHIKAQPQHTGGVRLADVPVPSRLQMTNDVPVMGTAAGSHAKGAFQFSMNPIDFVRRPPALVGARDVYALYVEGESMEPEFRPGQLIYVHPHKPPRIGDAVVIQCMASDGSYEATIGLYARRSPETIAIHKHNPKATVEVNRSIIVAIHKVLTTNELFGV